MKSQQPVYLLAGGRGRTILSTFAIARNIIKSTGKKKPLVAYVGAASLKDNWLIYAIVDLIHKVGRFLPRKTCGDSSPQGQFG